MKRICLLDNTIQEYAWGSATAIPELLGIPPDPSRPCAELWMGAHPKAPSTVVCGDRRRPLSELIRQNPDQLLGQGTARRFDNRLPYLFKVLAAARPLSIQAHPDRAQALEGFARENRENIPQDAPHRNYRDPNPKPECICALTPFWAMVGFRPFQQIRENLRCVADDASGEREALEEMGQQGESGTLKRFFQWLMTLPTAGRTRLIEGAVRCADSGRFDGSLGQWILRIRRTYPSDIGILSPLFLNLVRLEPGQALYLDAGELHAYLDGVGIELMANSDNVLRGGLTPKHVDVPELLKVLRFREKQISVLLPRPAAACEHVYDTPADAFRLSVVSVHSEVPYHCREIDSIQMLLCTEGAAVIRQEGIESDLPVKKGNSVVVPAAATGYAITGSAVFHKAAVPA